MIQNKVLYFKAECKIAGIIKMGLRGKVNFLNYHVLQIVLIGLNRLRFTFKH